MIKNLKLVLRNIKVYPILKYAVITYGILCAIVVILTVWQYLSIRTLVEESIIANKNFIETLTIVNDTTNQSYHIATNRIVKPIDDMQKYEYKQFLEKYFEHQSYYLNFWLSMLAIIIGIFAIIVPICFVKFFEDKKREIDKIITECKNQKEQTSVNVDEMKKQLQKVENLAKEVKANSMLSGISISIAHDISSKNYDKAISTINSSIEIMKTIQNLSLRAEVYLKKKEYKKAINDLEECLKIKREAGVLANLGCAYIGIKNYQNAKRCILESINLDEKIYVNYYNLTEMCIMLGDIDNAINALRDYLCKVNKPYITYDDKEMWIKKVKALPQNEKTKLLINMINNLILK